MVIGNGLAETGRLDVVRATRSVKLCPAILTINRRSSHDLLNDPWHALRSKLAVVQLQIVKTIPKNINMVVPKSRVALETWLAELRRVTAFSDLGAVFLSLQITELENKCAAIRRQMQHKTKPETLKKRPLRSAA